MELKVFVSGALAASLLSGVAFVVTSRGHGLRAVLRAAMIAGVVATAGCGTVSVTLQLMLDPDDCQGFEAWDQCFSYAAWIYVSVANQADKSFVDSRCIDVPAEEGRSLDALPGILNSSAEALIPVPAGVEAVVEIIVYEATEPCPPKDWNVVANAGAYGVSDAVELSDGPVSIPIWLQCPRIICSNSCDGPLEVPVPAFVFASKLPAPQGITSADGHLWVGSAFAAEPLFTISAAPEVSLVFVPGLGLPGGLAADGKGGLWVADIPSMGLLHLDENLAVTPVLTGTIDVPPGTAGLGIGPLGQVYVAASDAVLMIEGDAAVEYFNVPSPFGLAFSSGAEVLYVTTPGAAVAFDVTIPFPSPIAMFSGVPDARGIAIDLCGHAYVADAGLNAVVRFDPDDPLKPPLILSDQIPQASYLTFASGPGWDPTTLYVTSPVSGSIYALEVGVPGLVP